LFRVCQRVYSDLSTNTILSAAPVDTEDWESSNSADVSLVPAAKGVIGRVNGIVAFAQRRT